MKKDKIIKLCVAGLMAALCYVGYAVFPAITASGTKIHIGNAFVVIAALLLGPWYGGAAGAIGLTLADLLGGYAESAPRTFICKLVIGIIVGLLAHSIGQINTQMHYEDDPDKRKAHTHLVVWTVVPTIVGLGFNCIFEPTLKYIWYTLLIPNADKASAAINALLKVTTWATIVNALINSVIGIILYLAIRPALISAGLVKLTDQISDDRAITSVDQ